MKLLIVFLYLIFTYQISYANWYTNYDADGHIVSVSTEKLPEYDISSLKDQYVFLNKDPNAFLSKRIFYKEQVMKVGGTYIFNESLDKEMDSSNENFRFDRIITVEEQIKDTRRVVKSVLNENIDNQIRKSTVDDTAPQLIYKPYAVIILYSIVNKSNQVVESSLEKSSMHFLTLKECNTEIPKYRNIGQRKLNESFFIKSQLLRGKIKVYCEKIDKASL